MMDWKNYLTAINLDSTSYCNARCIACSRNNDQDDNKTQPWLPQYHMTLDTWKKISRELKEFPMMRELVWNGGWGDACMNPKLPDFLKVWGKDHPDSYVEVNTNGGNHNADWWGELGRISSEYIPHHRFIFAIDGVGEESHSKYRRHTSYNKIIENVKSFTSNGGSARWIMTMFDHNVPQVDDAIATAKEIGCVDFEIRPSFIKSATYIDDDGYHTVPASEISVNKLAQLLVDYGIDDDRFKILLKEDFDENWDPRKRKNLGHQCHWYNEGHLQIDPWGYIWPCCHTSDSSLNPQVKDIGILSDIREEWIGFNNVNNFTMTEIMTHPWYTEHLEHVVNSAGNPICVEVCRVKNIIQG